MVCLDSTGKRIGCSRFASTNQNFSQLATELTPDDCVAMEVTTNTFTIARILQPSGARITISDPIKTRVIAEAKIKTDKIDARVLAELDRVDYLPKVWLPDRVTEELRHFMSDRQSLVDRRTELKNRVHAIVHRLMISEDFNKSDLFGSRGRRTLQQFIADNKAPAAERFRLRSSIDEIDQLNERVEELESIIALFITSSPDKLEALDRLMSITGVSLVVGAGLIAAIGDPTRFTAAKKLASYFGLVPSTFQSGDSRAYHGRITKRGRAQARWLLTEAAEHMAKSPGPLRAYYQRIDRRRGHNIAIIALARKMAELAWLLLTRNQDYLYALPRLTEEKRARVRFIARGRKLKSGPKGKARSALYGSGLRARNLKTDIVRLAARKAEHSYVKSVEARSSPNSKSAAVISLNNQATHFDPLRPDFVNWQTVLEKVGAQIGRERNTSTREQEADPDLTVAD
jgi:transposase